jgi:hypothetical protein
MNKLAKKFALVAALGLPGCGETQKPASPDTVDLNSRQTIEATQNEYRDKLGHNWYDQPVKDFMMHSENGGRFRGEPERAKRWDIPKEPIIIN